MIQKTINLFTRKFKQVMKVLFNKQETEQMFQDALINGIDYISGHGLEITFTNKAYKKAEDSLGSYGSGFCYEDILMEILKQGDKLKLVDDEGGEDSWEITLEDVYERMQNVDFEHLVDMANGNDDAITADVILQTIFINEVIFG